jgi:hypothetical protein
MPFKSKAQRRKFAELLVKGKNARHPRGTSPPGFVKDQWL